MLFAIVSLVSSVIINSCRKLLKHYFCNYLLRPPLAWQQIYNWCTWLNNSEADLDVMQVRFFEQKTFNSFALSWRLRYVHAHRQTCTSQKTSQKWLQTGGAGLQVSARPHSAVSIGRLSTHHRPGTSTSQIIGRLLVCSDTDTVTDWWQKLHGSWTATAE